MGVARPTDYWLPLPESILRSTGWRKDDTIEVEVVDKDTLILRRVDPGSKGGSTAGR